MHARSYFLSSLSFVVLVAVVAVLSTGAWAAPQYKVLHAFTGGWDGGAIYGSLVIDKLGNLYGTTYGEGAGKAGVVFKLTPQADGSWKETVLHHFCSWRNCSDGVGPWAGLLLDSSGALYGTTLDGGPPPGYGNVFELTPGTHGWKETVLYDFPLPSGACCPYAGVIMDSLGNLYGTAGDPYELSPSDNGWKVKELHHPTDCNTDGCEAFAGVVMDGSGNLYGTTFHGGGTNRCGGQGCGTVYELSPQADGKWKEHILHRFQAYQDGAYPGTGALLLDGAGNVYGTSLGGHTRGGVIFRLSPGSNGRWKFTVLYNIKGGAEGANPEAGVVMDRAGNLYGTTDGGGVAGVGVVYKLSPGRKGKWTYTVLHSLTGNDGAFPDANLILDDKGNLYGTASNGGAGGYGVAFELTP